MSTFDDFKHKDIEFQVQTLGSAVRRAKSYNDACGLAVSTSSHLRKPKTIKIWVYAFSQRGAKVWDAWAGWSRWDPKDYSKKQDTPIEIISVKARVA